VHHFRLAAHGLKPEASAQYGEDSSEVYRVVTSASKRYNAAERISDARMTKTFALMREQQLQY
jgi:hypothetical protein